MPALSPFEITPVRGQFGIDLDGVRQDHNLDGLISPDRAVSRDRRFVQLSDDIGHGATRAANDRFGCQPSEPVQAISPSRRRAIVS